MFCKNCGKKIEEDSRFCRYCGTAQTFPDVQLDQVALGVSDQKTPEDAPANDVDNTGKWVFGLVGVGLALLLAIAVFSSGSPRGGENAVVAAAEANAAIFEAMVDNVTTAPEPEPTGTPPANWTYTTNEDKVRGGTTYYATTTSTNSIRQDSPYSDATTMDIMVRKSPAYGTDVLLTISSGQMMCPSYEGCSGTVSFDNGPAQRISFNGPADNSSETIFVEGAEAFIAKLKKSKRVVIEKTLYQAGNPQFEFDTTGLNWKH